MNLETTVTIHEPGTLQTLVNGMVSSGGTIMRIDSDGGYTEIAPGVRIHNSPPPNGTTMVVHNVAPIMVPSNAMPGGETHMVIHEPMKPIEPIKLSSPGNAVNEVTSSLAIKQPKKATKKATKKVAKKVAKSTSKKQNR